MRVPIPSPRFRYAVSVVLCIVCTIALVKSVTTSAQEEGSITTRMTQESFAQPDLLARLISTRTATKRVLVNSGLIVPSPLAEAAALLMPSAAAITGRFEPITGTGPQSSRVIPNLIVGSANTELFTVFSNTTSISIPTMGAASPYPSNIAVSGIFGTITKVTVTITGFSHTTPDDVDMLLVGPGGQKFMFMSDAGGTSVAVSNLTLTFDDAAAASLPDNTTFGSGTFKPTDHDTTIADGNMPAPAPIAPYNDPAPAGSGTFASVFNGASPLGTWSLYVSDDVGGDSGSISGGWSIDITTAGVAVATTTVVGSSLNPSFTTAPNNSTTLTATVTSTSTVNEGTVTFKDNNVALPGASTVNVVGGQAQFVATFSTEGAHPITAVYNGTANFATSTGSISQEVNNHTTINGNQFCNPGSITINDSSSGTPNPSKVFVSGLPVITNKVTLTFNGFSHPGPDDVDFLLVGPSGQKFVVMSDAGGQINVTNLNLTFDDTVANLLPDSTVLSSGTFKPTNYGSGDTFLSPAPAGPYSEPATAGVATFATVFNGANPNGTWSLYLRDDTPGDAGTISGGQCLTIDASGGTATNTVVTSSLNPSFTGDAVTITATVTESGNSNPVTTGTVTFMEGATPLASNVPLNAQGKATFTTSGFVQGVHTINALYSGTASFGASNGTIDQEVNNQTVINGNQYSNVGGITINDGSSGTPNPSKIFISGLGSICKITLRLNGFTHGGTDDVDVLLVGPNNEKFVVMSDAGGQNSVSNLNLTFDDAAVSLLPDATVLSTGTFKPTNYGSGDGFLPPAPAGPYSEPMTAGSATFASVFTGSPNGTWSLYLRDDTSSDGGSISGGWTLTLTAVGLTPTSLPNSVFGQSYSQQLTGTGGAGPFTFTLESGTLPTGVTLTGAGLLSGPTTTLGTSNFTIRSTDTATGCFGTQGYTVIVGKANTSIGVTSSQDPSVFGQPVTFTATVGVIAPGAGTPTGSVQFMDGVTPIGAAVALTGNTAQLIISTLSVGSHNIAAQYQGDTNFNTSTAGLTGNPQVVNKADTSVGLSSSQNPAPLGANITFTATLSVTAPGAGNPTGTVQFLDGINPIAGCTAQTVTAGVATCMTTALTVGNHTITAAYSGDASFNTSTGSLTGNPQVITGPPLITPSVGLTRVQGEPATNSQVAVVSDDVATPGAITVTAETVPAGITVTNIVNTNGTVTADIAALCAAVTGDNVIVIKATDGKTLSQTANLTVNVSPNPAPTLGNYTNSTIVVGCKLFSTPDAPPADNVSVSSVMATASGGFTGIISVDPATGIVTITNNGPVGGPHTITVTVTDNCGTTFQRMFTVTVVNPPTAATEFDFDGDRKADISVYRTGATANDPSFWFILRSSDGMFQFVQFGAGSDVIVPGDYDGDGDTDPAVYRPATNTWFTSQDPGTNYGAFQWGTAGDIPVPGQYDADNKTDIAVFRPSNGNWYIARSTGGSEVRNWGQAGDKPIPADVDGDGKTDLVQYRESEFNFYIQKSGGGTSVQTWGQAGDKIVLADYDGDGMDDIAVFRPSTAFWHILQSSGGTRTEQWGLPGTDVPAPADYDNDGKADLTVYRTSEGAWYTFRSCPCVLNAAPFGIATDKPIPSAFTP